MKKITKQMLLCFFVIVLKALNTTNVEASLVTGKSIPVTTKLIEFELQVTDSILIEPVYLDFGNIVKNSNDTKTANSFFYLSSSYANEMLVSSQYIGGVKEGEYTKYQVYKKGEVGGDFLDVYLHNIAARSLSPGENKVPIVGEIRGVGDVALGKYEKTVQMEVIIQPINPKQY